MLYGMNLCEVYKWTFSLILINSLISFAFVRFINVLQSEPQKRRQALNNKPPKTQYVQENGTKQQTSNDKSIKITQVCKRQRIKTKLVGNKIENDIKLFTKQLNYEEKLQHITCLIGILKIITDILKVINHIMFFHG